MNKSIILHQLFPSDIADYICSFGFYTLDECIEKNKKKNNRVISMIKKIMFDRMISRTTIVSIWIVLPITHQLIIANICYTCGNYANSHECSC